MSAMQEMLKTEYSGAMSIFLQTLLNKRYGLQYTVIDDLVDHFDRFRSETRRLPLLWHKSVLTLVQRYRGDFTQEQKSRLKELGKYHAHKEITREIASIIHTKKLPE